MKKYTKAERKLALAWVTEKVTHAEVQRKLKKSSVGAYVALALILRDYLRTTEQWK